MQVLQSMQWNHVTVDVLEVAVHSEVDRGDITSFLQSKASRLHRLCKRRLMQIHAAPDLSQGMLKMRLCANPLQGYGEDTMWPHSESLVFLHPTFRRKLAAVKRGTAM